jgi:hypothetical protein
MADDVNHDTFIRNVEDHDDFCSVDSEELIKYTKEKLRTGSENWD